jgi:peptide/nickel transport system substrate-binding protein
MRIGAAALWAVAVLTVMGCRPGDGIAVLGDDVPEEERYGGRMDLMAHGEADSLHPDRAGPYLMFTIINQIHEPLLAVAHDHEIVPELATDYEVSEDAMTYTLQLREGVVFHDGESFTSEDAKYCIDWYTDPENAAHMGADFRLVDNVEAPDEHTVIVHMAEPDISLLRLGLQRMIFPKHVHEETDYEGYSSRATGTGPFKLVEWNPDDFTLVEAFDDHWAGRPYLDEIIMRTVPEPSVRALELETGGSDSAVWPVGFDDALRLCLERMVQVVRIKTYWANTL